MDLSEITRQAMHVHGLYDELNLTTRGHTWSRHDFVLGFVGDVGDLVKLTQAADGVRPPPAGPGLAHELADCLWSVVVLAELYGVDLEAAFTTTVRRLEDSITGRMKPEGGR
ncbi:MazG nucleotide pyrophosphohydrolase domain-containing protein [Kitasatospora purpeofusca]|uniref:MazG nucleotide pyrophosphohydrolase domain-containing protein n=1 Tax=Kitasatospora purpeofusca TaxID=67352 RepID=UPI0004C1DF8B|nr:MazG nucleotide pyrophosphohydrolase domain-containing protein [Kitasatospora purpeofusca]